MREHTQHYHKMINSGRWRKLRAACIARDRGLCQDCLAVGRVVRATEVHHIEPVEWAGTEGGRERRMFDAANLVCLCRDCHHARHRELQSGNAEARKLRQIERALARAAELTTPGGIFN